MKYDKKSYNRNKLVARFSRGTTITEFVIYLALAGLVIAGVFIGVGAATSNLKIVESATEVASIQNIVRATYQASFAGLVTSDIAGSKSLSSKYVTGGGTTITSPFRGPVVIQSAPGDQNFEIALTNVDRNACIRMATTDLGTAMVSIGVAPNDATGVAGFTLTASRAGSNPNEVYSLAAAATACSGVTNVVAWRFN